MNQELNRHAAVVGGKGFVGRHVMAALNEVGVLAKDIGRIDARAPDVSERLRGHDFVINCAGRIRHPDGEEMWLVNAELPKRLFEASLAAGVSKFVHIGSVADLDFLDREVSEPEKFSARDLYGASKAEAERFLRTQSKHADMGVFSLRPPVIYGAHGHGPSATLIAAAARGLPLPLGDFTARRSMISAYNLASAVTRIVQSQPSTGGSFVVVEPTPYTAAEFYNAMCVAFGHPARAFRTPFRLLQGLAGVVEGPLRSLSESAVFDTADFGAHFGELPLTLEQAAARIAQESNA